MVARGPDGNSSLASALLPTRGHFGALQFLHDQAIAFAARVILHLAGKASALADQRLRHRIRSSGIEP